MKVLILHQHFKSPHRGGAVRSYYLAKALIDQGHDVKVITGNDSDEFQQERMDDITVYSLPVGYDNSYGFTQRSFSFLKFVVGTLRRSSLYRDVDIVYAISVPLTIGIAALWIKRRYKIPYIFEVGDLWPEAPIQMGFVKISLLKKFLFWLEKKIYSESLSIVALSSAIKENIERRARNKVVHLIPNMSDTCFYQPAEKIAALENKFHVKGRFVISYIGAIGLANGLEYFLECAKASQQNNLPVTFLLCGEGAMLDKLKASSKQMGLNNLFFIPFQTRDGVNEVMNVSDAVFVCYKPVPVLETGSPNKYFDGLSAGKLIIINFGGWIRNEIEANKCGIYVDPHQPIDFVNKIKLFLSDRNLVDEYQRSARALAEKSYSRKSLGEKFTSVIVNDFREAKSKQRRFDR